RTVFALIAFSLVAPPIRNVISLVINEKPVYPVSFWVDIGREHMRIFSSGTYTEQVGARLHLYGVSYGLITHVAGRMWGYVTFMVTILLGFYAGRKRLLEDVPSKVASIRRALWISLSLGIAASGGFALLVQTRPF